jgi:hypothetical protein
MNGELPPIDPDLRVQLARRAAGRLPEGTLAEVYRALDAVPAPRVHAPWLRPSWRSPRLLGAGMGLVLVAALLAVAVVVPAMHHGPAATPAGYPADRALTTAELAAVLAGPPLATNTTLVASVTIDVRMDICPMNRYPTVGLIEGMGSQVCVMGYRLEDRLSLSKAHGTYAFRYLGPGYLGLLGEVTPRSGSRVAFDVTDDWPLAGKAFLVDGWLGADGLAVDCLGITNPGDVLYPEFGDCGFVNWLSIEASAPLIDPARLTAAPGQTPDTLALRGQARAVMAGGMRLIDGIDHAAPIHGVFVVRADTTGCPNALPIDSRGCSEWHVLAKVSDLPSPAATPSPTAGETPSEQSPATPVKGTPSPGSSLPIASTGLIGPGDQALTPAELTRLIAGDPEHLAGRYVIDSRVTCDGIDCKGVAPQALADKIEPDGSIGLEGPLSLRPDGSLVWTASDALASKDIFIYIVDAWLTGTSQDSCDVAGQPCYEVSWLGSAAGDGRINVQLGAYHEFGAGAVGGGVPIHGLFLVEKTSDKACGSAPLASIGQCSAHATIFARLESVSTTVAPGPTAEPTRSSLLTPAGLIGKGNKPLSAAEYQALVKSAPADMAGRTAFVSGDGTYGPDGTYWAVTSDARGFTTTLGQVRVPKTGYTYTLPAALVAWNEPGHDALFLVDAWLDWTYDCDTTQFATPETGCNTSLLTSTHLQWMHMKSLLPAGPVVQWVQDGAYISFGSSDPNAGGIHGLYLVDGSNGTALARLDPVGS